MVDIALCFLPIVYPYSPPSGIYKLYGAVCRSGLKAEVHDFNLALFEDPRFHIFFTKDIWAFSCTDTSQRHVLENALANGLDDVFERWADTLLKSNPTLIALSLFSHYSIIAADILVIKILAKNPQQDIIFGGAGCSTLLRKQDLRENVAKNFKVFANASEKELLEYYFTNYPEKRPHEPIKNTVHKFANYDSIDFSTYDRINGKKAIALTGSTGCVRKCTFCDVSRLWSKYQYRDGEDIFEEMAYYYYHYDRKIFRFTDSLINGNMANMRKLCHAILRQHEKDASFWPAWGGQAICRPARSMPAEDIQLMTHAGCGWLTFGIESGSESVRKHMRKYFSNNDIYYTLAQAHKNGITANLLMLVGYVTETEKDFQDTLDLLDRLKSMGLFTKNKHGVRTIQSIGWGESLSILDNTPLYDLAIHDLNIDLKSPANWEYGDNTRLERLDRLFRAIHHTEVLGAGYTLNHLNSGKYNQLKREYLELSRGKNIPHQLKDFLDVKTFQSAI